MIILSRWGPFCMTALSNEKNTMHYLMRLVQVLVGAVLQNGGGHPQDCQDVPLGKGVPCGSGTPSRLTSFLSLMIASRVSSKRLKNDSQ